MNNYWNSCLQLEDFLYCAINNNGLSYVMFHILFAPTHCFSIANRRRDDICARP